MPASRADLSTWFDEGTSKGATHMIVKCDTFDSDQCCYPVFVEPGQDPHEVSAENRDRTMECYALFLPKEAQMAEGRANHWEMPAESC